MENFWLFLEVNINIVATLAAIVIVVGASITLLFKRRPAKPTKLIRQNIRPVPPLPASKPLAEWIADYDQYTRPLPPIRRK